MEAVALTGPCRLPAAARGAVAAVSTSDRTASAALGQVSKKCVFNLCYALYMCCVVSTSLRRFYSRDTPAWCSSRHLIEYRALQIEAVRGFVTNRACNSCIPLFVGLVVTRNSTNKGMQEWVFTKMVSRIAPACVIHACTHITPIIPTSTCDIFNVMLFLCNGASLK